MSIHKEFEKTFTKCFADKYGVTDITTEATDLKFGPMGMSGEHITMYLEEHLMGKFIDMLDEQLDEKLSPVDTGWRDKLTAFNIACDYMDGYSDLHSVQGEFLFEDDLNDKLKK